MKRHYWFETGSKGRFAGVGDTIFIAIYGAIVFFDCSLMGARGPVVLVTDPLICRAVVLWFAIIHFGLVYHPKGKIIADRICDKMKLVYAWCSYF